LRVVTISVGVAVRDTDREGGVEKVLAEADEALYRAKSAGRNRVVHQSGS
jgi:diguanylate cyclase (GGDEF)-like protein